MERESFEDDDVAALLNEHFVAIKVDREERPDIDHIYMMVCQAMTGQGGWPLTVLMTPDQKPFFAGTYFPKERRYGRHGLMDILGQVADKWHQDRENILAASAEIEEHMKGRFALTASGDVSDALLAKAVSSFQKSFDPQYGGFGSEPKFPSPHNLMFLLRCGVGKGDTDAIAMVEKTLDAMSRGGIYDHVGFGFARYSVDREWLVPHFEKMLYDNALLAMTYIEAYQVTGKVRYADVARDIFTYVLRDMTDASDGFYCAEDADSEGEEGKFYVWTLDEVMDVLGDELGEKYADCYGITREGNFEGYNIPNLIGQSAETYAAKQGMRAEQWDAECSEANKRLFARREMRVHPHKDDKMLTAWNALMIVALAKGARALQQSEYATAAVNAAEFILEKLVTAEGRLLARYRDGEAAHLAYLDDYAFFVWALIELYETTLDERYLAEALRLNDAMKQLFWDDEQGGFFFYGSDGEALLARPKEVYDGAIPSGNSVAALNLLRLARMTGRTDLEQFAERQIEAFVGVVDHYPTGHSFFLMAVQFALGPTREIVIAGDAGKTDTMVMKRALGQLFLPDAVIVFHPDDSDRAATMESMASYLKEQVSIGGKATVYICENFACQSPKTDVESVVRQLTKK